MSHIHWVVRGTGTPEDRDEVNRREVCKCDGWVCDLDVMGDPSKLIVRRKTAALARARPTLLLSCEEKAARRKWNWPRSVCASWTPEAAKKRSVSRWACKNKSLTNSLCKRFVYYESIKWDLKIKPRYECRCDERLQTKTKRFTRLSYTGLLGGLEHLEIETRLIDEKFANAMGEYVT